MENKEHKILLAEDDENLGMLLCEYLNAKGFNTELMPNGEDAYNAFVANKYDICIFDVMMPKKDGFTLAKEIRMLNTDVPIIFLTAKSMKDDILQGFKVGADDYLSKPFSMEELLFRIEAILRRTSGNAATQDVYTLGIFKFDTQKQQLINTSNENLIKLTTKESELLKLLCINANKVLERNIALKTIWVDDNYFNARSMDVYITKLRKHLKEDPSVEIINVHGKGYKLVM
jgi:DNA-binding response OmpR family regulator